MTFVSKTSSTCNAPMDFLFFFRVKSEMMGSSLGQVRKDDIAGHAAHSSVAYVNVFHLK
jgi:hypothetical protein